ncbi:MAG: hypothetical protein K8R41_02965 [Bacteroidales bacterium]|nr:hypothetical protein [Bacteroidales bacterium]
MILKTKSVRISDEALGCQIIFSDTEPQFDNEDEKYILIQKFFDDDIDEIENYCYIESHEENITGHYNKLEATLKRDNLELKLKKRIINIYFDIEEKQFNELKSVLKIILHDLGEIELD